jgi:hypothetical protein
VARRGIRLYLFGFLVCWPRAASVNPPDAKITDGEFKLIQPHHVP